MFTVNFLLRCQLNCYGLAMEFSIVIPFLTVQIHFNSMRKGEYRNDLVVDDAGLRVGCVFFFFLLSDTRGNLEACSILFHS